MTLERASIEWVRDGIAETLALARAALEDVAEKGESRARMADCARCLHEIGGVVEMLGFRGVRFLAAEMETLAVSLLEESVAPPEPGFEALMHGIAQLPEYLELVRGGHRDDPALLLGVLNELRAARGAESLGDADLFRPDLDAPLPPAALGRPGDEELRSELRKLRPFFQRGLVGWFRGAETGQGIGLIAAVVFRLSQRLGPTEARRLWWVAAGVAAAIRGGELAATPELKRLVGRLDGELKRLATDGGAALDAPCPPELLRGLLGQLVEVRSENRQVRAVRAAFGLAAEREASDAPGHGLLAGPDLESLRGVTEALKEDIARVKDSLDTYVRNENRPAADLAAQADVLGRVANTLGLLSLSGQREELLHHAEAVRRFRAGRPAPSQEELMAIARALLNVDSTLDAVAEHGIERTVAALDGVAPSASVASGLTGIEYLQLLTAVVGQCRENLAAVRELIATFIAEPDDYDRLEEIPRRLDEVEGGLAILSLERARGLLAAWKGYVRTTILERREIPAPEILDALADAVVGLEYYLEAVADARADAESVLDRAAAGVHALRSVHLHEEAPDDVDRDERWAEPFGELDPLAVLPAGLLEDLQRAKDLLERIDAGPSEFDGGGEDDLPWRREPASGAEADGPSEGQPGAGERDPAMLEIFLEEAAQVARGLDESLPRWLAEPADASALIAVRRGFHTLKGSGAIVGANEIGEFAFAFETLLNAVIEGLVPPSDALRELVRGAAEALPALVGAVREGRRLPRGAAALKAQAERATSPIDPAADHERAALAGGAASASILSFPARHEAESSIDAAPARTRREGWLRGVFAEEARGHLGALNALLAAGGGDAIQRSGIAHAPLMRIFHTFHGSAQAAGMSEIAALCSAMERFLVGLRGGGNGGSRPIGTSGLALVRDCVQALGDAVASVGVEGSGAVPAREALLTRIGVLAEASGVEATAPSDDFFDGPGLGPAPERLIGAMEDGGSMLGIEPDELGPGERRELREAFLEEAGEILESTQEALHRFRGAPARLEALGPVQRQLHTLKGGARLAGLAPVGDLSHALESLLLLAAERMLPVDGPLLELLERAHDRLEALVDGIRSGRAGDAEPLLAEIDGFVSPGTAPDASDAARRPAPGPPAGDDPYAPSERVRVSPALLDELVAHAGELSITQSRIERSVGQFRQNLEEMEQTVSRLQDQLRRLELETESQIRFSHQTHAPTETEERDEFDPLELDRYSDIQQLSRALAESVADLSSIQGLLDETTRQSELLLLQQARTGTDLQHGLTRARMLPFVRQLPRLRRVVRETARELDRRAELVVRGEETELDRSVLGRIRGPLEHMLRNCVDHGIEPPEQREAAGKPALGRIELSLYRDGHEVVVEVVDDGRGMDRGAIHARALERGLVDRDSELDDDALLALALEPSLSTADSVTQISGRGVGLDVANAEIKQLGGTLEIRSRPGVGTTFRVRVPFTLAVNQAMLVSVAGEQLAVPLGHVETVLRLGIEAFETPPREVEHEGQRYRLTELAGILGLERVAPPRDAERRRPVILVRSGEQRMALAVDELSGRQEVVVKPVGRQLASIRWLSGATILGDGRVVLVVDVAALMRLGAPRRSGAGAAGAGPTPSAIMVVDDSITVRKVTDRLLTRNGMRVVTAKDGVEALAVLQDTVPDLMLLDIEMPRMDGFELAAAVRKDPALAALPIIVITSRTGAKHSERARQIGVQGYLGKPYQEQELLDSIRAALGEPS